MLTESTIAKGYGKLAQIKKELGFIPHLLQEMNANPATLMVYLHGQEALANGVLTPQEQQAVQLRVSLRNACHYCQAAHKWLGRQSGLPTEDIEIIVKGGLPKDERLAAILDATDLLMERKGWLSAEDLSVLERQGVDRIRLYEIIAFIGLKTISNYINHIAHTPIDEPLRD